MDIIYPSLPAQVYRNELLDAIRTLGFDPNALRSIHIGRRYIEVKAMLSDENGKLFAAGDEVATVTVRLPITEDPFVKAEAEDSVLDDESAVA